jgi:signal recognition particle receptor subunit beta
MKRTTSKKPAIIVLTGASGAGKTTLVLKLSDLALPGVVGINCDRVKLESNDSEDPSDRQAAILQYWLSEIQRPEKKIDLAVLDTQIRPHRALEVLSQEGIIDSEVVLVDCERDKRNERLRNERQQSELATRDMDCWAAYLRGQADALGLNIIDTSEDSIEASLEHLMRIVAEL